MTALHGFVDESIRRGWYRLTIVVIRSRDLAEVTRAVRSAVPTGQTRLHLSSEGQSRKRAILRVMGALPVTATTFMTPHELRSDDQISRDRCLRALAAYASGAGLGVLVLDTRGTDRDRRDGRTLRAARVSERRQQHDFVFSHRGSRDEPLLSLPDGIGWAVGAGRPWRDLVAGIVAEVIVDETG